MGQNPAESFLNSNLEAQDSNLFTYIKASTFPKIAVFPDGRFIVHSGPKLQKIDGNLIDLTFNAPLVGEYSSYPCQVKQILALPDGKVMLLTSSGGIEGSTDKRLVRLNQDGSLDLTFNLNFSTNQISYKHLALQADGKLLIAYADEVSSKIVRLNTDGSIDTTFAFATNVNINSKFIVLPNGKIVFDSTNEDNLIMRQINADGSLDNTYAVGTGF